MMISLRMNKNEQFLEAAVAIAIVCALALATFTRNYLWMDKMTMWKDVVGKSPAKARAYNNLGHAYHEKKQLNQAIECYKRSIALNPYLSLDAYSNLASIYVDRGQYDNAIDSFTKILFVDANDRLAYANRGNAYYRKGEYASAVADYTNAITLAPYFPVMYLRRAEAFMKMRDTVKARADWQSACMLGDREGCARSGAIQKARRMGD